MDFTNLGSDSEAVTGNYSNETLISLLPQFNVVGNCVLLNYYAKNSDNSLPTFRENLSAPSSKNRILDP
jgi:hypothetical protein